NASPVEFAPIPAFAPEHFAAVRSIETSSYKSFGKGVAQLREEGAVQVFYPWGSTRTEPIFAVVGELQFDVAKYRLETEYKVKTVLTRLPFSLVRHVQGEPENVARMQLPSNAKLVEDWEGRAVALFESDWSLRLASEWNPALTFARFSADSSQEALAS
ncbi:MAG: peptide chain release factor 3, partial [Candidatus Eremiobacteraeota bacterium]|nr:peptide chain release factor 3 [Candidatus Eremiobacteraeota bacterium]